MRAFRSVASAFRRNIQGRVEQSTRPFVSRAENATAVSSNPPRIGWGPVIVLERRGGVDAPIPERRRRHSPNDSAAAEKHAPRGRHFSRHLQHHFNGRTPRQRGLRQEEHAGVADVLRRSVPPGRFADRPITQVDADGKARRTRNVWLGSHARFAGPCKSGTRLEPRERRAPANKTACWTSFGAFAADVTAIRQRSPSTRP
jgi:hypothetical protein